MERQQLMERIERECSACDRHFMRIREAMVCLGIELRNDISHEYTTTGHDEVELLNELIGKASELERIYNRAKAKMAEYGNSGRGLF